MMRKKFWGVLLILAAIALVISRLGLKYSVPLGFWQVVGTLFFGAGLIEGLSKKKIGTSVFFDCFFADYLSRPAQSAKRRILDDSWGSTADYDRVEHDF